MLSTVCIVCTKAKWTYEPVKIWRKTRNHKINRHLMLEDRFSNYICPLGFQPYDGSSKRIRRNDLGKATATECFLFHLPLIWKFEGKMPNFDWFAMTSLTMHKSKKNIHFWLLLIDYHRCKLIGKCILLFITVCMLAPFVLRVYANGLLRLLNLAWQWRVQKSCICVVECRCICSANLFSFF